MASGSISANTNNSKTHAIRNDGHKIHINRWSRIMLLIEWAPSHLMRQMQATEDYVPQRTAALPR